MDCEKEIYSDQYSSAQTNAHTFNVKRAKLQVDFQSSFLFQIFRLLQKDAEHESLMRSEIQNMKQELSTISMMDEFARYARLERKINKMTDKLKTHGKYLSLMFSFCLSVSSYWQFLCFITFCYFFF